MKVSKKIIRRLIRESINDFFKSDFIGTESGAAMLPQKVYSDIRNWFEKNQEIVKKLRAFKKEGEKIRYSDPPKSQAYLSQAEELSKGVTSDILPSGMSIRDIEKVRAQYIAFIGKTLLDNTPKLKQQLGYIQSANVTYQQRQSDMNQMSLLFETLFEQVDEIGIGPVNYEDFKEAVNSLGAHIPDYSRYFGTRMRGIDPLKDDIPPSAIPVVTGGLTPHEKEQRKRKQDIDADNSYFITQQLRDRKSAKITNNLSLVTIFVSYEYDADEEMIGSYVDSEITEQANEVLFDIIYEYDPDLAVLGYEDTEILSMEERNKLSLKPGMRGYNKVEADRLTAQPDDYGRKLLLICTQDALDRFIGKIENINFYAEDVGQAMSSIEVEFVVDERQIIEHIKPNSMASLIDFVLTKGQDYRFGIPARGSASEMISQHKEFLEIVKDYQHDLDTGGNRSKNPDLGEEFLDVIFDILIDMGHDYQT